jgi:hypothetical protein
VAPMTDTAAKEDANLAQLLVERARRSTDDRLVIDAIGGLVAGIASVFWHGRAWYFLFAAAVCFFAFGIWGITDRELGDTKDTDARRRALLQAIRLVSAILGFSAVAFTLLLLLGVALGRVIS